MTRKKGKTGGANGRTRKTPARARRTQTIKFLTLDETRRLFEWIIDKRDKAIFLVAYRHGLRASEIGLLRVSDVDFKRILNFLRIVLLLSNHD